MSSIVLMRILESAPDRYDAGMEALSLGAISRAHRALAAMAVEHPGASVLEIGCGTGSLTAQLLARGARVEALDQNPEMLDRARARFADEPTEHLTLRDATAAEIDGLPADSFDAVAASLVLSEMSRGERAFVLGQALRVLKPGGRLAVADEVRPARAWQRIVHALVRIPLALLTWIVTGTTTHAIPDLVAEVREAGFIVVSEDRSRLGTLALLVAERRP